MFRVPGALSIAGAVATALLSPSPALASVTIEWVTVGNPGNGADVLNSGNVPGIGSVNYVYRIAKYEVTNEQYLAFLNAVAVSDPNGLYDNSMGFNSRGGITRFGTDGNYTYALRANMANKPVNFVSWYNAARFCNWMTNGQPTGAQDNSTTESGVYTLNGPNSIIAITRDFSNPNQVFIPTEDEWYKAAYHQPFAQGGDIDDYWLYATQSNSTPTIAIATPTGDVANPGPNVVNYLLGADWNGLNGNVTTVGSAGSTSFYGAFDMNGNLFEWNEQLLGTFRGLRGGTFNAGVPDVLWSTFRSAGDPIFGRGIVGFRLASPVLAPGCSGDINGDDTVNLADFNLLAVNFGAGPGAIPSQGDINGDGFVDLADFNILAVNFGSTCP